MQDKISVIIPIYNVEPYLKQCLDSVINQTYKELEILLIDDGSLDKCGEICDTYAAKDLRIKVVHKRNGGLSDARNEGLNIATGKYITFIDSDDVVAFDMIEYLHKILSDSKADISVCQSKTFTHDIPKTYKDNLYTENIIGTQKCLEYYFSTKYVQSVAWGKLYRKQLFENIRYPVGKLHEDEFTTYRLIALSKQVSVGFNKKYFYRLRSDSIMNVGFSLKRLDAIEAALERREFIDKNFPEISLYAECSIIHAVNFCVLQLGKSGEAINQYDSIISQWQMLYRKYEKSFLKGPNSRKSKCFSLAAFLNLKILICACQIARKMFMM